jgi:hypothetical protein
MNDATNLFQNIYPKDPYWIKIKKAYDLWKNNQAHEKIAISDRKLYILQLHDKFTKIPDIIFDSLLAVNFSSKECFKLYIAIYKIMVKKNIFYLKCPKSYLCAISKMERFLLYRVLKELQEKNMLLISKEECSTFIFTLNLSPLSWNLKEENIEEIKTIVNREVDRVDKKWIKETLNMESEESVEELLRGFEN